MSKPRRYSSALLFLIAVASAARVEAKPVTVTITSLWQIGANFDLDSLGDFYAKVTINGKTLSSFDQHLDFGFGGFIVPTGPLLPPPLWVLTNDVPDNATTVPVHIEIWDADPISDDKADINPGPKDSIDLQVDLATGKWTGDVTWPQTCSAGPFNLDSYSAGVCFDISVLSSTGDLDGDGLLDGWEQWGYHDPDGTLFIDLPALGASPFRKDVFVEVDCLAAPNHSHCPSDEAIRNVVRAFAKSPPSNPDGTNGIQLHVDVGNLFGTGSLVTVTGNPGVIGTYGDLGGGTQIDEAGNEIIAAFGNSGGTDFFDLKRRFFDFRRAPIFRYAIFGHQTNGRQAVNDCTSGIADGVPGRDFLVTLGGVSDDGQPCWTTDVSGAFSIGSINEQAGTFMHELGHTLGLNHGGATGINFKPNYLSVMNYSFQMSSVPASPAFPFSGGLDYSRLTLPSLDETNLDECFSLGAGLGFGPMDWNADGTFEGITCAAPHQTNVTADINIDGVCIDAGSNKILDTKILIGDDFFFDNKVMDGRNRMCNTTAVPDDKQETAVGLTPSQPKVLDGFDDWGNLQYSLLTIAASGVGGTLPADQEANPTTIRQARDYLTSMLAPDVVLRKTGPATAKPGDVLTYTDTVTNSGHGPALNAVITDVAPDGSSQMIDINAVVAGGVTARTRSFTVPLTACPGDFTLASASVAFKDFAGNPGSASASLPLQILDVGAPTLTVSTSPSVLWPPDHKMRDIVVTITVKDNCDPKPKVTLISVTSNEPETGLLGQGDQGPDIQGADFGTDDRAFSLRAERGTSGHATGRVYTITYRATDSSGNSTDTSTTVVVPINSGGAP